MASDVWSRRSHAYATSTTHREGPTLSKLIALARPHSTDRCLDIGTGAGHTAARLASRAGEVVALDPAAGMLDRARALYGHVGNLTFQQAPGEATGLPTASFDLIAARHTLHHHHDPHATLCEARRLLKPGGRLVIADEVTPNADVDAWYHALERARDATHVRAYTLAAWQSLIETAGLSWVVGDTATHARQQVDAWIDRMDLSATEAALVKRMFKTAPAPARTAFSIHYDDGGEPVSFAMPMALILAIKEE